MKFQPSLIMLDLDGTLYVGEKPFDGAVAALNELRARGYHLRFLTNTTVKSQAMLVAQLRAMGFTLDDHELISAPVAARLELAAIQTEKGRPLNVWPLVADAILQEFSAFQHNEIEPDFVVVGDIGESWTLELINRVFQAVQNGAEIIALHKGRFWQTETGLNVDIGFFVAGLEYACNKTAQVMGKPNRDFFARVIASVGCNFRETLMIGDDVDSDVGGAQRAGIKGGLVKTGKYRQSYFELSGVVPDLLLETVAELPSYLK